MEQNTFSKCLERMVALQRPERYRGLLQNVFCGMFIYVVLVAPLFAHAAPIVPCGNPGQEPCGFNHFLIGINNVINFLIMIGGSIAAIVFAWAGILILTAGANESQVTKAKGMFWAVLKGFALMLAAWILVKMVLVGLGVPDAFSLL
ncbi:MAG: hypothetical protein A3C08_01510 [Candidatus Taylorbacteria bacterium RIFCSPHIGHO2_02_FULL_47_18]|uniref:Uncharacterized protein n=1 Tax=Candidatus Taylorbacteria bacterium RIFCSPLOWO2_01_FULL_48_100 TaxID=1802322 RepID=A0A1G2NE87_9BACT|nr:MAG: hypothetical protein A2670_01480 [Candidatus Taylorbacteria bacterium RIFCSPHIGHO2_01_FULL_48_38]OHA28431.1 MAG: hypothetical protein A3C08_01510 [Candidatus Taylorbacteria bacterium RIFCSPHIGHO2_02_FULL_47_18]OHA34387.1 MAG: hypothetical protein A2938_00860 [Candidatus Taylorbacteria bacterium RIFCSPLOWO2_01_FULL_48_100]OHA40186.1 MAG: hypothetical protein A3J31_01220 [Candidatus Taylorbacteria bacterium RIFCSPLOWO2_02_FULL_48_16]OHA45479.1 MAG: hypothetical protein A3H13_01625 [Candid